MRKQHTSMTDITRRFQKVFRCGYCDLQHVFRNAGPMYYNSGEYGWNCDIYVDFEFDIAVTTGYRNTRGIRIPNEIIEKYEANALKILESIWVRDINDELIDNRKAFYRELNDYYTKGHH